MHWVEVIYKEFVLIKHFVRAPVRLPQKLNVHIRPVLPHMTYVFADLHSDLWFQLFTVGGL